MMKLKVFKIFFSLFILCQSIKSQNSINGFVVDNNSQTPLKDVKIFDDKNNFVSISDSLGYYFFNTYEDTLNLNFVKQGFSPSLRTVIFQNDNNINLNLFLSKINTKLDEVVIYDNKSSVFETDILDDIELNSIYSGKKSELILTENRSGTSFNNARQMYNQSTSINIYQTDDAGLQLNIGGRGLDPRRSSNFNVRQNNYEISADPLGYPETYYSPPFECLENIQLIRGAGSLQYGTQFGGLVNFNIKKPNKNKNLEIVTRNTTGSNNFYSNFTSFSGTLDKIGYYTFFNYKIGDGFRPDSNFDSYNLYSYLRYDVLKNLNLSFEVTYLNYLAKQPGGLTDIMFYDDIFQSNRERNWFEVNWLLYNFQASYDISNKTNFSISSFILDAHRYAVGFRSNRVDQIDSFEERDLIKSNFNNVGVESKLLHKTNLFNKKVVYLLGAKFYSGSNSTKQGPGTDDFDANFDFQYDSFPNYENQSNYSNPNLNYSIFNENIFYLNSKISFVPGFRFEYIKTSSDGFYRNINTDGAGNVILNNLIETNNIRKRSFFLYGIGFSYKFSNWSEFYTNYSRNYRAVTFSDINIINPSFIINPNISDESGYTSDFGFRGNYKDFVFYDINSFYLFYSDRIGFIQNTFSDGSVKNEKGNVGDAILYGQEFLVNFNLSKFIFKNNKINISYFFNFSNIYSEYISSRLNGVEGNQVEFVPRENLKTGFKLDYKNFKCSLQYSYMSEQFTDATNSVESDLSGVIGILPKYDVLDLSFSYLFNKIKFEFGINNILDNYYFTNRATGYPGPGIIPSPNRNCYITIQYKI